MSKIGIRCDCGVRTGMGHLARQKLIYKELKNLGNEVYFFIKEGVCLVDDIPILDMSLIQEMDCLIIDILEDFEDFDFPGKRVVFHDSPDLITIKADIIFALNYMQSHHNKYYDNRYFLGLKYNPMEFEFPETKRVYRGNLKKILIMTSGVDPWNMPSIIYNTIKDEGYDISILISKAYKKERFDTSNIEIVTHVEKLAEFFSKFDLLICTVGNVAFEAAASGLPTISFSVSKVQEGHGHFLNESGASQYLGGFWNNTAQLNSLLTTVDSFNDSKVREEVALKGKVLCDGRGLKRVIDIVKRIL